MPCRLLFGNRRGKALRFRIEKGWLLKNSLPDRLQDFKVVRSAGHRQLVLELYLLFSSLSCLGSTAEHSKNPSHTCRLRSELLLG
jgi:hypothetical protein